MIRLLKPCWSRLSLHLLDRDTAPSRPSCKRRDPFITVLAINFTGRSIIEVAIARIGSPFNYLSLICAIPIFFTYECPSGQRPLLRVTRPISLGSQCGYLSCTSRIISFSLICDTPPIEVVVRWRVSLIIGLEGADWGGTSRVLVIGSFPFVLYATCPQLKTEKFLLGWKVSLIYRSRRRGLGRTSRVWLMGSFPFVWYVTCPQLKTLNLYVGWRFSLIYRSRRRRLGRDEQG